MMNNENDLQIRQNLDLIERERRDIAFELHNEMGQQLTAIRTAAQLMCRQSEGRQCYPVAQSIVLMTDQIFTMMYQMLQRLRPTTIDKLGLHGALEDLKLFCKEHLNLDVELRVEDTQAMMDSLDSNMQLALYRIVQEALINASRHGHARRALVKFELNRASIKLWVSNNGTQLHHTLDALLQKKGSGMGLVGVQQRVRAWHGKFQLENAGLGVLLSCQFPLDL